jgi:hypothetical protein
MNAFLLPVAFWAAGFAFYLIYTYHMLKWRRRLGERAKEWASGPPRPLRSDEIAELYTIPDGMRLSGHGMFACAFLMMLSFMFLLGMELL